MARPPLWNRPGHGPTRVLVACLVALPVLAGCTTTPAPPPPQEPGAAAARSTTLDGALQLEALLGRHTLVTADMMRGRLRDDEDFAQAASTAVGQNTDDLAQVVASLGGEPGRFRELWADQVTALFGYARALATQDDGVQGETRTTLEDSAAAVATYFAEASGGRLDADVAGAAVSTHVALLTTQADAYAAADYPGADADLREGHRQAVELGHLLATNLLPAGGAAEFEEPVWQLRSAMTRLLGEHVGLALATLRAGATNAPDFPSAADALNGNTTDVTAAVASLFGEPGASQFLDLWADHLDLLGTYAADVGAGRTDRRAAVSDDLRDWQQRFATFIETATGDRVAAPDLAATLLDLDDILLQQVDSFAAGDFDGAQELSRRAYPLVFALARSMADAFGATVAAAAPEGGARTGAGGAAQAADEPFRSVRTYDEVAEPVRLRVPAAGVDTSLLRLGTAADGSVEVPAPYDVAGWFTGGPRPGQTGPAVILGHVDSRAGPGVFFRLEDLSPGAQVHVDRADGSTATFRVTDVLTVPKDAFPTELVYAPTLQPALRLVTCGGPFDDSAGSYRDNVIVTAEPEL